MNGQAWRICGMILTGEDQKYGEENLSQRHFIHHKSHMDWPGIQRRPAIWGPRLTAWTMARYGRPYRFLYGVFRNETTLTYSCFLRRYPSVRLGVNYERSDTCCMSGALIGLYLSIISRPTSLFSYNFQLFMWLVFSFTAAY